MIKLFALCGAFELLFTCLKAVFSFDPFRGKLAVELVLFFVLPLACFGIWQVLRTC